MTDVLPSPAELAAPSALAAPVADSDNPYVGARTFQAKQADRYFGREREAQELLALVITDRLTLFYAESGTGKSSLVNTRLIPSLQAKGFEVLPVGRVGGNDKVPPGVNPYIDNLLHSLLTDQTPRGVLDDVSLKDFLLRFVFDGKNYVYVSPNAVDAGNASSGNAAQNDAGQSTQATQTAPSAEPGEVIPRVLIIDQFEEVLTSYPRSAHQAGFFDQLRDAMRHDLYLWVVLVLREDYVAGLDPFAHRTINGLRTRYNMQRMGEQAASDAIRLPAEKIGHYPFADDVVEALVANLCKSQAIADGGTGSTITETCDTIEPVQLQLVCHELWKRLGKPDNAATHFISRAELDFAIAPQELPEFVDGALGNHYEQTIKTVVTETGVSERALRDWFSNVLIRDGRTPGMWFQSEAAVRAHGKSGAASAASEFHPPSTALDILTREFLIHPEKRGTSTWYELGHARFIPPIVQANREWLGKQNDPVTSATRHWLENGRADAWLLRRDQWEIAQKYANEHPGSLGPPEREFLDASKRRCDEEDRLQALERAHVAEERARERSRLVRWLKIAIAFVCMLAIAFAVAAVAAIVESNNARRSERIAQSSKWSAMSALESDTDHKLLLAREALTVALAAGAVVPEAEGALLNALAQADQGQRGTNQPAINAVAIGPDPNSRWLVEASADGALRLNDLSATELITSHKIVLSGRGETSIVEAVAISPDGHWLVTANNDDDARVWTAHLWDLTTRDPATKNLSPTLATVLNGHSDAINAVAISFDSHWLATAGDDTTVRLWDLTASDPSASPIVLAGHAGPVTTLAISPDGHWLATANNNDDAGKWTAHLWDLTATNPETGSLVLSGHTDDIKALAFSHDSRWLVTTSDDAQARLWDLSVANPVSHSVPLTGHSGGIIAIAISPDDHWLVTASSDKTARLWDLTATDPSTGSVEFEGHTGGINGVAFSRDGRWLVTGSSDMTARRWDLKNASARPIVLKGHLKRINALAIGARWLVTAGDDGQVLLWDMDHWGKGYRDLIDLACIKASRNLYLDESQSLFGDSTHVDICPGKPQASNRQVVNQ